MTLNPIKTFILMAATLMLLISMQVASASARVAMLISSNGTEQAPDLSYDLEELAQAYLVLHDNGIEIDIVSPNGGPVLVKNNKDDLDYIQRFKELALAQLNNTIASAEVNPEQYDGVFIIGGGGAMIDLPSHDATQALLTAFVHDQKLITAVCHGPAAITDITLENGDYFVAGKRVNSFTNVEEHAFSKESAELFPFLIEDRMKERGATFVNNAPMLPFVAVDGNLITAQNPGSVATAAEAMVLSLGQPLVTRESFKDERTLALINNARSSGTHLIDIALSTNPEAYDLNYLALYGFYAYGLADDAHKAIELELMATIGKHFDHPVYADAMIRAMIEQQQFDRADQAMQVFAQKFPESGELISLRALLASSQAAAG